MLNGPEKEIKESSPDGEDDKKPVGENDEEEADDGDATADMTPLSAAVYNNHIDVNICFEDVAVTVCYLSINNIQLFSITMLIVSFPFTQHYKFSFDK